MANYEGAINETADWDVEIPQLSAEAILMGGAEGTLNAQAKAISAKLNSLKQTNDTQGDAITEHGTAIETINNTLTDHDERIANIEGLEETVQQHETRLDDLEFATGGSITALTERVEDLETLTDDHETRIDTLENSLSLFPDALKIAMLQLMYPVGTPYFNRSNTNNPNTIFGVNVGTWVRESGRFLAGYDSGQTEFDSLGETGGAKGHKMTLGNLIAHNHQINHENTSANTGSGIAGGLPVTDHTVNTSTTGSSDPDPIPTLPPYVVYSWWVRTA